MSNRRLGGGRTWMAKRLGTTVTAGVAAATALTACGAGTTGSSSAQNSVSVAYDGPTADFEAIPIIVAQKKGFYKAHGVNVNLIFPPNNSTTVKMVASGQGDIGFDTTTDVAFARQAGIDMVSIANYSQFNNWALIGRPGETISIHNLKNKKIGVFTDSWTKAMMPFILRAAGLNPNQIQPIIATTDDIVPLLASKIDIATNTTNYAISEVKPTTGKMPSVLLATKVGAPNVPIWVYTGMSTWLKAHPKATQAFLAGTEEGMIWATAHPNLAASIFQKAYPKNGLSLKSNLAGWESTATLLKGRSGYMKQDEHEWAELVTSLKGVGALSNAFPPGDYFTNAYLPK